MDPAECQRFQVIVYKFDQKVPLMFLKDPFPQINFSFTDVRFIIFHLSNLYYLQGIHNM